MRTTDLDTWEDKQSAKRRPADVSFATKLGAARHALALAEEIPDIVGLLDNAEAIRAAAKAKHVSAEGINAWTRFIVDAEREAWKRIKAMRAAGELAKQGHHKNKNANCAFLDDLIDHRPNERAAEWAALAKLGDDQLDAIERVANEEDRLITRRELLSLGKAGTPMPTKEPRPRSAEALKIIGKAREQYAGDNIQIEDNAKIAHDDRGAWVAMWGWVEDPLTRSDLDDYDEDGHLKENPDDE